VPDIAILTRQDGRYRWPLDPGRYRVFIAASGYSASAREVEVSRGKTSILDFVLEPVR
jgi:hypothetical protein